MERQKQEPKDFSFLPFAFSSGGDQMKCKQCGAELDLLEIIEDGQAFECSECACIHMLKRGCAPKTLYNGPPPLDYYFHD